MVIVPENLARLIAPQDRVKLKISTAAESQSKYCAKFEREEHKLFRAWCDLNNYRYRHDRTDKRTSCAKGWPDFTLFMAPARTLFLEFKRPDGRFSPEQLAMIEGLRRDGFTVLVPQNALQAITGTREWMAMSQAFNQKILGHL